MKKFLFILSILSLFAISLFFTREKEEEIVTIIKNNKNTLAAIHYPKTKYTKLNKDMKTYITETFQRFENEYEDFITLNGKVELNIDYEYHKVNQKYHSVTFYTHMDAHDQDNPYKEIVSFVYDKDKNRYIHLLDLSIDKATVLDSIKKQISQKYKVDYLDELLEEEKIINYPFIIRKNNLILYIPYYQYEFTYLVVSLPISLFKIEKEKEETNLFAYKQKENVIDPSKKVIALTFDDGPSKYTNEILDLLQNYQVSATFFVLGNKVDIYQDTLKKLLKNGNEIGNHSYSHKWLAKLDEVELKTELDKTNVVLKEILGYTPTCLRPTYGSVNQKIINNTNMEIVLWNVDTLDWKLKNHKKIAKRGLKVKDGDIILMHDTYKRTVKALKIMIPALLEEGYQFVTINELQEVKRLRENL